MKILEAANAARDAVAFEQWRTDRNILFLKEVFLAYFHDAAHRQLYEQSI